MFGKCPRRSRGHFHQILMLFMHSLVMNPEETPMQPTSQVGPITDAYLHREVHPEEGMPPPKPARSSLTERPHTAENESATDEHNEENLWMYT